jgi:hypothetical protein
MLGPPKQEGFLIVKMVGGGEGKEAGSRAQEWSCRWIGVVVVAEDLKYRPGGGLREIQTGVN